MRESPSWTRRSARSRKAGSATRYWAATRAGNAAFPPAATRGRPWAPRRWAATPVGVSARAQTNTGHSAEGITPDALRPADNTGVTRVQTTPRAAWNAGHRPAPVTECDPILSPACRPAEYLPALASW